MRRAHPLPAHRVSAGCVAGQAHYQYFPAAYNSCGWLTYEVALPWHRYLRPYVRLTLLRQRPRAYAERPKTLGEHLLKKRLELGLTQRQVALRLLAKPDTYFLWEKGYRKPTVRNCPVIIQFLEYDPFPAPTSWNERVAAKRRSLGLTIEEAAKVAGVDPVTFGRWERGQALPHGAKGAAHKFLSVPADMDAPPGVNPRD